MGFKVLMFVLQKPWAAGPNSQNWRLEKEGFEFFTYPLKKREIHRDLGWWSKITVTHASIWTYMNPFTTSSDANSSWANVITTQTHSQKKGRFGSWAWENFSMQGSFILVWVETEALWEVLGLIPFDTIDGSEIRLASWGWSFIPLFYNVLAPSQVVFSPDFWTINNMCLKCLLCLSPYSKKLIPKFNHLPGKNCCESGVNTTTRLEIRHVWPFPLQRLASKLQGRIESKKAADHMLEDLHAAWLILASKSPVQPFSTTIDHRKSKSMNIHHFCRCTLKMAPWKRRSLWEMTTLGLHYLCHCLIHPYNYHL